MHRDPARPRVAVISYLNTVPLVWGLENGPRRHPFRLDYCLPAEGADRVQSGQSDIGLLPIIEMARQGLACCPGTGIACDGPVRSILLISKVPPSEIRTLAVDRGSRTSVMLARVILSRKYSAHPSLTVCEPVLDQMLADHDAALIIGDPALHLDPASLPFLTLDLGQEWKELTGLPMVFAVWCGPKPFITPANSQHFLDSLSYGERHIATIVAGESAQRHLPPSLVHTYLTHHIRYRLGENEYRGMRAYLDFAAALEPALEVK
ncbi:MAG: menaquinone biosynthesis protein [Acidobacteria bacterium]|nr:menaquinone biosynthesis protein [Acidobacteriota bacterium]